MKRFVAALLWVSACSDDAPLEAFAPPPSGGAATNDLRTTTAFENPVPDLDIEDAALHRLGDGTFDQVFVTGGSPVGAGLGPLFNNTACGGCHLSNGRGLPLFATPGRHAQALLRISVPDGDPEAPGGSVAAPGFGLQLQDEAVFGLAPEVHVDLDWIEEIVVLGDGTEVSLRRPDLTVTAANGAELPDDAMYSFRTAPPAFGLGLIEAIPAATVAALADPEDVDGDGISGRLNMVWDSRVEQFVPGRFGWKANTPDLELQAADAYFNDMGITSRLHPNDDGTAELSDEDLAATVFYTRSLAVPGRDLHAAGDVRGGEALFAAMGCGTCHASGMRTGQSPIAALSEQTIYPYSDFLLHDMGVGLADGRGDFEADGREWRTTTLWGLGLVQTVLPGAGYLHDGRARTVEEAILWHGGEAQAARDSYASAPAADRAALLAFLRSL